MPLPSSQVAWTARNLKHMSALIWITSYGSPCLDKPIAPIDLIGYQLQIQMILLGITGGTNAVRQPAALDDGCRCSCWRRSR